MNKTLNRWKDNIGNIGNIVNVSYKETLYIWYGKHEGPTWLLLADIIRGKAEIYFFIS